MKDKFQNKYRIESSRLKNWDYGRNGSYFITICTKNREFFFGDVIVGTPNLGVSTNLGISNKSGVPTIIMKLSEIGEIAEKYWLEIPQHFPFVKLDSFVIMPNHIHGIIVIDKPNDKYHTDVIKMPDLNPIVETPKLGVSTTNTVTTNGKKPIGGKNKKWKPGTLGTIINQYKRICTINARKIVPNFAWQYRFYDHIIRNRKSYQNISEYIINNPIKWAEDKFNSANKTGL